MRRIRSLILAVVVSTAGVAPTVASGANLSLGVKGGANYSNVYGPAAKDTAFHTGFAGGGFVQIGLRRHLGLRAEVLYATRGVDAATGDLALEMGYLEIPILAVVSLPVGRVLTLTGHAGPVVATDLSAKLRLGSASIDVKSNIDAVDFAAALGAGADVALGPVALIVEGRATLGLDHFAHDAGRTVQARHVEYWLGAGLRIPVGAAPPAR